MIQLMFLVLFMEGIMAFLLLVKIGPLRELIIKSLDQLKMGKGLATMKTIAGTMSVILLSSLMSIFKIQNKGAKLGTMSPMDQVLWRTHLLEASLMGNAWSDTCWLSGYRPNTIFYRCVGASPFDLLLNLLQVHASMLHSSVIALADNEENCSTIERFTLFLGFIIDRMHHYIRTLIGLRSSAGSSKEEVQRLQEERMQLKEKDDKASMELKLLKEEISTLSRNLKKVKSESKEKDKKIEIAEAHIVSLQKQSADLLLEYDHLLENNQKLQNQALGHKR
ncbi:B-cell receptor-associated protein 31-like isoform X2 [Hibiscus syriacus]|uniref:Endoplasmic reticulum transmembrane protein n=1 Tax=Hibiscus syriacus TaxID=106335 RepID=A0A6A2Y0E0_HIBSY|nr:B-cell receptor-associated protein 31-like isoform X2 [Hibiscus syriacus]